MIGITQGDTAPGVPVAHSSTARSDAGSRRQGVNDPGATDIDIAQLAEQVTTAYANYRAALQTNASIRQLSLLSFLD